jgi:hypothetical protein
MKAITAYIDCGDHFPVRVLARANISTVADFRQLLKKALIELYEIRRDAPSRLSIISICRLGQTR